jgi:hypothetical protein
MEKPTDETTKTTETTVLPPEKNATRQANGTTQRMPNPIQTDPTFEGLAKTAAIMLDRTANGDMELGPSKVAAAHTANAISALKGEISLLNKVEHSKNPAIRNRLVRLAGWAEPEQDRFLADLNAQNKQQQITAKRSNDPGSTQSD